MPQIDIDANAADAAWTRRVDLAARIFIMETTATTVKIGWRIFDKDCRPLRIERSATPDFAKADLVVAPKTLADAHSDQKLTAGTTYYYRLILACCTSKGPPVVERECVASVQATTKA